MEEVNFLKAEKREQEAEKKKRKSREKEREGEEVKGVNLMTKEAIEGVAKSQMASHGKVLLWSVAAAVVTNLFLFFVVSAYGLIIQKNADQLQLNLGKIDQEIADIEKNASALTKFQNKLSSAKSLLDSHIYWSQFLTEFEKQTLPTVSFGGLSVTTGSPFSLSATAPDFKTLGKQLLAFQRAAHLMSGVHVTAGNAVLNQFADVTGVSFEVAFTLNPEVLKKKAQ